MNAHADVPERHVENLMALRAEIEPLRDRIDQLEKRLAPSTDELRELDLLKAKILPLLMEFYGWSSVPVARFSSDLLAQRQREEQLDLF